MAERTFDHGLGAGLAVLLQKLPLQRSGVDADAHGAAVILGRLNDVAHARRIADVARIDPQARRARLGGLDAAFVVKMDIGDERDLRLSRDSPEGGGRLFVWTGDANDVGTGLFQLADLVDRRSRVRGRCVGHRLDGDRRVAAHRDIADHDLAAFAALDVAPRTNVAEFGGVRAHDTVNIGDHWRQDHDARGRCQPGAPSRTALSRVVGTPAA